jgi:ABC-type transport system substrate-binding protein
MIKNLLKFKKIILAKKTIDVLIIVLFFSGLLFLIYYLQLTKPLGPKYGGFYREGLFEPINSLNPVLPKNESEKAILNIIYPPLIEFNNGKIISKFLNSYYFSPDKLTLNLELKDLKWSDGSKITTDDLVFSFELFKKYSSPEISANFKNAQIKIIDQKRAEINLNLNDDYFFFNLNNLKILPVKIFSGLDLNNFDKQVLKVGSGPFIFDSITSKGKIIIIKLKRNEFYRPKPYFEEIYFYVFPSTKSAFEALLLKEIDGLAGLNYLELPQNIFVNYKVYKIVLPRIVGLFFNSQKIDKKIIEDLESKIDREEIKKEVFKNNAEISYGIFSTTIRKVFSLPDLYQEKSQKPAVINQPLSLKITVPTSYFYPEISRYLKEKYHLETEFIEPENLNETLASKNYQAILTGLNYSHPPFLSSFFSKLGYNINNLDNLELERSFQQLITDPSIKMNEKLKETEEKILKTKSNIFLVNPYYLYLISKKISGFDQFYLTKPEARFVKIEFWYRR